MSEYTTVEYYVNHVINEITKSDVEQVSERLRALGWEKIVRCRDCRYYDQNDDPSEVYPDSYWCDKLTVYMPPNGFCPWGKDGRSNEHE